MKKEMLACVAPAALGSLTGGQSPVAHTGRHLPAMERASMEDCARLEAVRREPFDDPKIQSGPDMAVLSYQLVTRNSDVSRSWSATEVYQRKNAKWKVIHTHLSAAAAPPQ